jgi:alginate O-acetyltransferase complex protein AlgI
VILATKDSGAYGKEIVPPVQGGEVNGLGTRAFSPGYHIDGLSALLNGRSEIAASEVHARPALIGEGGRILGVFRVGNLVDWLPLFVLPPAAAVIGKYFPAWVYMWVLAFALFAGCKWVCLRSEMRRKRIGVGQAVREVPKLSSLVIVKRTEVRAPGEAMRGRELLEYPGAVFARTMGFLFGWVGMDVENFLRPEVKAELPRGREWLFAGLKILLGAGLVWMGARAAMAVHPLLAGWIGMFGIILVLHFGLFHLLALGWRAAGVPVTPLMRVPLLSRSLGEFWGSRWNTAFNRLVATFLFRPLHRATNVPVATLIVFLVSGLLHEFVISVPARGGYGWPTVYFLVQGAGVLFEHTPFARRLGLGRGVRGWLFMFAITAGPAFWLFHPPFIEHVILPMLHAIGAT